MSPILEPGPIESLCMSNQAPTEESQYNYILKIVKFYYVNLNVTAMITGMDLVLAQIVENYQARAKRGLFTN